MCSAGLSGGGADEALYALDSHLYGYTLKHLLFPIDPSAYADTASAYVPIIDADIYPHLTEMAHAVIGGHYDGSNALEFGLDLILDGLDRLHCAGMAQVCRRRLQELQRGRIGGTRAVEGGVGRAHGQAGGNLKLHGASVTHVVAQGLSWRKVAADGCA